MRETVMQTVARYGQGLLQQGGPVLTGWASKEFAGLDVRGHSPRTTSLSFVIVHLPISPARKGSLVVPYGVSTGARVEQDGTEVRPYEGSDIHMGDGYVVKEFRLPGAGSSFVADSLQVFCEYRASSARVYGRVRFAPTPSASAAPPVTQAISLRVYNWKTASWDTLKSSSGTVPVPNPAAHVLLPEAVVRVKFVHHPGAGSAGDATLRRLDISLSGHFK
jgi:hypothetical protein